MSKAESPDSDFSEWRALLTGQPVTPNCLPDVELAGRLLLWTDRTARLHFELCLRCMGRYARHLELIGRFGRTTFRSSLGPQRAPQDADSTIRELLEPAQAEPADRDTFDFASVAAAEHPAEWAVVFAGCRKDDHAAWQEFLRRLHSLARGVLWRYWLSPLEREEIEDRVRVNLVQAIMAGRFDQMEDPARYITAAVRNAARDTLRQRWPQRNVPSVESDHPEGGVSPLEHTRVREQAQCVEALVRAWGAVDRFIFVAKLEGVATATIQQRLLELFEQISSAGAIDVRFNRLRKRLRKHCA